MAQHLDPPSASPKCQQLKKFWREHQLSRNDSASADYPGKVAEFDRFQWIGHGGYPGIAVQFVSPRIIQHGGHATSSLDSGREFHTLGIQPVRWSFIMIHQWTGFLLALALKMGQEWSLHGGKYLDRYRATDLVEDW